MKIFWFMAGVINILALILVAQDGNAFKIVLFALLTIFSFMMFGLYNRNQPN